MKKENKFLIVVILIAVITLIGVIFFIAKYPQYKANKQADSIVVGDNDDLEDIADIKRYPKLPEWFEPRQYQIDAINSWKNNCFKGLLSMATGTGKTLTALYGLTELWLSNKKLVTIIVCPYQHLVEQWAEDVKEFNIIPILCYSSHIDWRKKVFNRINLINSNTIDNFTIITTNATFTTSDMQEFIRKIRADILFQQLLWLSVQCFSHFQ